MIIEEWKPIPEYNSYFCSDLGRIKKIRPSGEEYILRHKIDKYGYPVVCICINSIEYTKTVHRLVARCFIENPEFKPEVNHIDGNKTNNFTNNLEWNTTKENRDHAVKIGLHKTGKKKVVNLDTGIVFDSVKEAFESSKKNYSRGYFERMLSGNKKNKTTFKLI